MSKSPDSQDKTPPGERGEDSAGRGLPPEKAAASNGPEHNGQSAKGASGAIARFCAECPRGSAFASVFFLGVVSLLLFSWAAGGIATRLYSFAATTTVVAESESLRIRLNPGREQSWSLPPGEFVFVDSEVRTDCEQKKIVRTLRESRCAVGGNTRLEIAGGAEVALQIAADGSWIATVARDGRCDSVATRSREADCGFSASVIDSTGKELVTTRQSLSFRASPVHETIRLPLIGESVLLGTDLHEKLSISNEVHDYWQPVLLSGSVRIIARNWPFRDSYNILEESLDVADVVRIGDPWVEPDAQGSVSAKPEGRSLLVREAVADAEGQFSFAGETRVWGMAEIRVADAWQPTRKISYDPPESSREPALSVDSAGTASDEYQREYQISTILHSSVPSLEVSRFGAPEGHQIKASSWTVLAKWPTAQSTWVFFISLIVISQFYMQLVGWFGDPPSKQTAPGSDVAKKPKKRRFRGPMRALKEILKRNK